MQKYQFPVRSAFAITIRHKAKSSSSLLLIWLIYDFMHEMIYVAFYREQRGNSLKEFLPTENPCQTRNVLGKEVLKPTQSTNFVVHD